jgi:uncharacterized protein YjiS (DUF1127 family)
VSKAKSAALWSDIWELNMKIVLSLPTTGHQYGSVPQQARHTEWLWMPKAVFAGTTALLGEWRRRYRERAQLAVLDERMLRDIGVNRSDVLREVNKPFWRA